MRSSRRRARPRRPPGASCPRATAPGRCRVPPAPTASCPRETARGRWHAARPPTPHPSLNLNPGLGLGGRAAGVEPLHELVQAELLEPAADRVQLGGAELDQPPALLAQLERLAQ